MANATSCIELSMDAYCTLARVGAYIPRRTISDASIPTRRQTISLAKDVFQEINGLLDVLGYVIPIASGNSTSMSIVGRLNALGAAAAAEAAAYSAGNAARSEHADYLNGEYRALYTKLEKGLLSLPSALRTSSFSPTKNERKMAGDSGSESSTFTKGMDF